MTKRYIIILLMIGLLPGLFSSQSFLPSHLSIQNPQVSPTPPDAKPAIENAIQQQSESRLISLIDRTRIDELSYSKNGLWAKALLIPIVPENQQVVPTEPGLAIAQFNGENWSAFLPGDPDWSIAIENAPEDILTPAAKAYWLEINQKYLVDMPSVPLDGYLLPWAGGQTMYMTQSVKHDLYTPSGNAHYAFDFAKPGYPSGMFELYAAKGGTVKRFDDHWENGHYNPNNPNEANYIVLEDTSTSPTTYQLYLHLAQNSIPAELKVIGAQVNQGQFIGVADDTGVSTGNHLHFQVHTNPNSYWGTSVDITFDDVTINGGRPRNQEDLPFCQPTDICTATSETYISGNYPNLDHNPPSGDILTPEPGITAGSPVLHLEGWATDNETGVASAQFIANYNGTWHDIGPSFSTILFAFDWDLCATPVSDGPISLALRLQDQAGNQTPGLPGLRHLTKNLTCPIQPPACQPGANQVALYTGFDFSGECNLFPVGSYPLANNLGNMGQDNVVSIQTGVNVMGSLYAGENFHDRGETFLNDDANLDDNWLGANSASSLIVQPRSSLPLLPIPIWPTDSQHLSADASWSLSWENAGNATRFQARILENAVTMTSPWINDLSWQPGIQTAGTYSWQIRAGNSNGESDWSNPWTLILDPASPSPEPPRTLPYTEGFEQGDGGWLPSSLWALTNEENHTPGGNWSWRTKNTPSLPSQSYLTSPLIQVPVDGGYLRFWYFYETENPGEHWDRRWVQISASGGAFNNILQLSDDRPLVWLQSPIIDLSPYAGQTVQLRFYSDSVDRLLNNYTGWYIDDLSITNLPPPNCSDADNSPDQAVLINLNTPTYGRLCPAGDKDYYRFFANTGDQIGILVRSQGTGSTLDPTVTLLAQDGSSILAQNDDLVPDQMTDSFISYRIPNSGQYFIKIKAKNHPGEGGLEATYIVNVYQDSADPTVAISSPLDGSFLFYAPITVTANVFDAFPGISHVEFWWHTAEWEQGEWTSLKDDWDSSDGWNAVIDPTNQPEGVGIALVATAFDWAGNSSGTGVWNLGIDLTPPTTQINPLSATQQTSVIHVSWSGNDPLSGVHDYDLQRKQDTKLWKDIGNYPEIGLHEDWIVVESGHDYSFRVRGTDNIGNRGTFPTTGTSTTVPPADILCSAPDSWEVDNSEATAQAIPPGITYQYHNLCNPAAVDRLYDEDWFRFTLQPGDILLVDAVPQDTRAAVALELYDSAGINGSLLVSNYPIQYGSPTHLLWRNAQSQVVFLRARHANGRAIGNTVAYQLRMRTGKTLFLPLVQ